MEHLSSNKKYGEEERRSASPVKNCINDNKQSNNKSDNESKSVNQISGS